METWPDAAFTPFRCAKGSTWEGGVRVPGLMYWPGMIEAGRAERRAVRLQRHRCRRRSASPAPRTGCRPTATSTASTRRSFLLAPDGLSNRKYHYYWLTQTFSGLRCGEYKMVLSATSDNATDAFGTGGFTGVLERFAYPRLYNLYLDPKEQHNYLTRKLAYIEAFQLGMRNHLGTFKKYPAKKVMGIKVADKRD